MRNRQILQTQVNQEQTNQINHEQLSINLGLDIGTANITAAYSVHNPGVTSEDVKVHSISFLEEGCAAPNIVSIHASRVVWGFELRDLMAKGEVREEEVVEFMKLGLYEGIDTEMAEAWEIIKAQLKRLNYDFDKLLAGQLEAIVLDCLHEISRSITTFNVNKEKLAELPVKIRVCLPEMFSPYAKQQTQEAAKLADLPLVSLASEPQVVWLISSTPLTETERVSDAIFVRVTAFSWPTQVPALATSSHTS